MKNRLLKLLITPVLLILTTVLLSGCISQMFAGSLVHANRQPIIKTPSAYGLEYNDISFKTSDNLTLSGWEITGDRDAVVIITIPMNFSKYGYSTDHQGQFKITDIEVEFIKTAKNLNEAGYHVIMFDLRNHGESDDSADKIFGLGNLEWRDIEASLDYVSNSRELSGFDILFASFCTGANATFIAMDSVPEKFRNVVAVAAIQPISMDVFVNNFIADKYSPLKFLIPSIEKECIKQGGLIWDEMSPALYIKNISVPIMIVQGEEDPWTDISFIHRLYGIAPEPKRLEIIPGLTERFQTYNYFGDDPTILLDFFDQALNL